MIKIIYEVKPQLVFIDSVNEIEEFVNGTKQETRRLRRVSEIVNVNPDGSATTKTPFIWNAADDRFYFKKDSEVFKKISMKYGTSVEDLWKEFDRRTKLLHELTARKVLSLEEFQKEVNDYYKNPESVLKKYGIE